MYGKNGENLWQPHELKQERSTILDLTAFKQKILQIEGENICKWMMITIILSIFP